MVTLIKLMLLMMVMVVVVVVLMAAAAVVMVMVVRDHRVPKQRLALPRGPRQCVRTPNWAVLVALWNGGCSPLHTPNSTKLPSHVAPSQVRREFVTL